MTEFEQILCFQARAGDRADGNIPGALTLAESIASAWNRPIRTIGTPSVPRSDSYADALLEARNSLDAMYLAVLAQRRAGLRPICVLPTDGAAPAVLSAAVNGDSEVSVIWFDAHADFNTPRTTKSGFLGGMSLAAVCGLWDFGCPPATSAENVVLIGARAVDVSEMENLQQNGILQLAPTPDVVTLLAEAPIRRRTYIHLDLDCLEPGTVPTQYSEPNGLTPVSIRNCIEHLISRSEVIGFSLSEFYRSPSDNADPAALNAVLEMIAPIARA